MSTDPTDPLYDDINDILQRMCPQTLALARHERCAQMLRRGARELIGRPQRALEVLGPKGTRALGRALDDLGKEHQANGQRMQELAAEAEASTESSRDA